MAVYLYMKGVTPEGNPLLSLMDESLILEVNSWENGIIDVKPLQDVYVREFMNFIIECFKPHSTLENVKAIEFEFRKIRFHVTKENAIFDKIMRHYYDNICTENPKEYA